MGMKITNFEFVEHIVPKGISSGTGYSEPDKFKITFDDGSTDTIYIDIWYLPGKLIRRNFNDAIKNRYKQPVNNMEEAFELYKKALLQHYTQNDLNHWFND